MRLMKRIPAGDFANEELLLGLVDQSRAAGATSHQVGSRYERVTASSLLRLSFSLPRSWCVAGPA
jgi:hypothetical protein